VETVAAERFLTSLRNPWAPAKSHGNVVLFASVAAGMTPALDAAL
jgi:hypothetical protein